MTCTLKSGHKHRTTVMHFNETGAGQSMGEDELKTGLELSESFTQNNFIFFIETTLLLLLLQRSQSSCFSVSELATDDTSSRRPLESRRWLRCKQSAFRFEYCFARVYIKVCRCGFLIQHGSLKFDARCHHDTNVFGVVWEVFVLMQSTC